MMSFPESQAQFSMIFTTSGRGVDTRASTSRVSRGKLPVNRGKGYRIMSYDIRLKDPVTNNTIQFDEKHHLIGGTYEVGGTTHAWLNITYNYAPHFKRVFGEKGIRTLYGMTGADSIPLIEQAVDQLKNDVDENYWKPTEGNAKAALYGLLAFAKMRPDGIWDGD